MDRKLKLISADQLPIDSNRTVNDIHTLLRNRGIDGYFTWSNQSIYLHIVKSYGFGVYVKSPVLDDQRMALWVKQEFVSALKDYYSTSDLENVYYAPVKLSEHSIFENYIIASKSKYMKNYNIEQLFKDGQKIKSKINSKHIHDYSMLCTEIARDRNKMHYN